MNTYCKYILSALLATVLITAHADEKETMAKDEATAAEKGKSFQERKARKIEKMEARLACMKASSNKEEMKDCRQEMKKHRKDHRGKSADKSKDETSKEDKGKDKSDETDMEKDEDMKEKSADEMKSKRKRSKSDSKKVAE